MHQKGKVIFWDWTGTLADESRFDCALCSEIDGKVGGRYRNRLREMENTWHWFDYVSHFSKAGLDWKALHARHRKKLRLIPGAKSVLSFCRRKGYANCLLTNAVKPVIELRLKLTGCSRYFDLVLGCDEVRALKEKGRHLKLAMRRLKVKPENCIAVGDNPVQDLIPARKLGIRTVMCEYGAGKTYYHTSNISANHGAQFRPDYSIKKLPELRRQILSAARCSI